jgi:hypothetical protein
MININMLNELKSARNKLYNLISAIENHNGGLIKPLNGIKTASDYVHNACLDIPKFIIQSLPDDYDYEGDAIGFDGASYIGEDAIYFVRDKCIESLPDNVKWMLKKRQDSWAFGHSVVLLPEIYMVLIDNYDQIIHEIQKEWVMRGFKTEFITYTAIIDNPNCYDPDHLFVNGITVKALKITW